MEEEDEDDDFTLATRINDEQNGFIVMLMCTFTINCL